MRRFLTLLLAVILLLPFTAQAASLEALAQALPENAELWDLGSTQVTDYEALMALIESRPTLKEVHLFDNRVPLAQMEALTTRFPHIFFGFTIRIHEHTIRTDQTAFSTLHNNRAPRHLSRDFEPLKYCTRLEALDLGHNAVEDISFVSGLTEIKVLILALNKIRDISPLKNLRKLEYVEIFRNYIEDISVLEGLPNILDLNLGYNRIKDYSPLHSLKTLERLWLYNSNGYSAGKVPYEVVQPIRAALPDCFIDARSGGTGGTWREHPRYFTIFDIFKDSIYKPFDPVETNRKTGK